MAEGQILKGSLEGGHDTLHDYQCSLCEEDGKHVQATKYCKDCYVYMCYSCLQTKHNLFPLNKRHQMLEKSQFETIKESTLKSFPVRRCSKHPGELINMFCGDHDVVCCIICKTLEHSNCKKNQHILEAAKGMSFNEQLSQKIIQEMKTFLSDVNKIKEDGKLEIERVTGAKEKVKHKIFNLRKQINVHLKTMESKSLDEVKEKAESIIGDIINNLSTLDESRAEVESILEQTEFFNGENDCELFVNVKQGKQILDETKKCLHNVSELMRKRSIYFEADSQIENFLKSVNKLGSLTDRPKTVASTAGLLKTSVNDKQYTMQPFQFTFCMNKPLYGKFSVCRLASGFILVAYGGKNIQIFDENSPKELSIGIQSEIISLCEVGPNEAAVLYNKNMKKELINPTHATIQNHPEIPIGYVGFIHIGEYATLNRFFCCEKKVNGMIYCDGLFYICCEMDIPKPDQIDVEVDIKQCYHVAVFNKCGQLKHTIPQMPMRFYDMPNLLSVSDNGRLIVLQNMNSRDWLSVDESGSVIKYFTSITVGNSSTTCDDGRGNILVCSGNTVSSVSLEEQKTEEILKAVPNEYPVAACYSGPYPRLLVLYREQKKEQNQTPNNIYGTHYTTSTTYNYIFTLKFISTVKDKK